MPKLNRFYVYNPDDEMRVPISLKEKTHPPLELDYKVSCYFLDYVYDIRSNPEILTKSHIDLQLSQVLDQYLKRKEVALRKIGFLVGRLIVDKLSGLNNKNTYLAIVPARVPGKTRNKLVDVAQYVLSHPEVNLSYKVVFERFKDVTSLAPELDDHLDSIDVLADQDIPIGNSCNFILLDDLVVTGNTLNACLDALDMQGYSGRKAAITIGKLLE
jgi:hypothetical protein